MSTQFLCLNGLDRLFATFGSKKLSNRTGHSCSTVWGLEGPGPNLHQRLLAA